MQMKTEKLHNKFTDITVCLATLCIYIVGHESVNHVFVSDVLFPFCLYWCSTVYRSELWGECEL